MPNPVTTTDLFLAEISSKVDELGKLDKLDQIVDKLAQVVDKLDGLRPEPPKEPDPASGSEPEPKDAGPRRTVVTGEAATKPAPPEVPRSEPVTGPKAEPKESKAEPRAKPTPKAEPAPKARPAPLKAPVKKNIGRPRRK